MMPGLYDLWKRMMGLGIAQTRERWAGPHVRNRTGSSKSPRIARDRTRLRRRRHIANASRRINRARGIKSKQ